MQQTYRIEEVVSAMGGTLLQKSADSREVRDLLIDSRKLQHPVSTLFFAIEGARLDGHNYLFDLYAKGVRSFVVSKEDVDYMSLKGADVILVKNAVDALQKLALHHRQKFSLPVIGITGSNGKTMVKEWLNQLLFEDYRIVRSPKSYNSQIGVSLSLWQIDEENNLGIFEAGISEPGEMERLEKLIKPTIGIFTNVGDAHSGGFLNIKHKTKEKLKLFVNADILIYCKDYADISTSIAEINTLSKGASDTTDRIKTLSWSQHAEADVKVTSILSKAGKSYITLLYSMQEIDFEIPFMDKASIENAIHCAVVMLYLQIPAQVIKERMLHLTGVAMRLELKKAINNCLLINDSYNADINALRIAIEFLNQQQQHAKKTVILSDILQSGKGEIELYEEVAKLLQDNGISRLVGIGPAMVHQRKTFEKNVSLEVSLYSSTEDFIQHLDVAAFSNETILLKGARRFKFEIISRLLEKKAHETVLEINLNAIAHNLKTYQSLLKPATRIMAMVKAFAYGSGSYEVASILQFNRADYLAVAYTDEGVDLRKHGIRLPVMVMNPEANSFETMIANRLEPDIYSIAQLSKFADMLAVVYREAEPYPIHIELETGMHRLGFEAAQVEGLIAELKKLKNIRVASVFSHLAASEAPEHDDYTRQQIKIFDEQSSKLVKAFDYKILRHILNSGGISRHTDAQFDMVRLGIGLYGIDASDVKQKLEVVSTLKTSVSQIKHLVPGDTIGYGRVGKAMRPTTIATVGIGYADGLSRRLSNGVGSMVIRGKSAPVIGNICMDMTMLDITDIPEAMEGDEVVIFGRQPGIEAVAKQAGTIPYELLTGVSGRVKRVYFQE
jgi:alanine racemase